MTYINGFKPVVLLVEDYPPGMFVSKLILEELGFTVEDAISGFIAVEKVRASRQPYLAILMDINMLGMDGFEATKVIREIEKIKGFSNTIIAMTAHNLVGDRTRCLQADLDDYISKPIQIKILENKLTTLLQPFLLTAA